MHIKSLLSGGIGRASVLLSKLLLTLFIARYLSVSDLGLYGLVAGSAVALPMLLGFGFANSVGRDYLRLGKRRSNGLVVVYWVFIFFLYFLAALFFAGFGSQVIGQPVSLSLLAICFLEAISQDAYVLMLARGQVGAANVHLFVRSALWIYLYVGFGYFDAGLRSFDALVFFWLASLLLATIYAFWCLEFIAEVRFRTLEKSALLVSARVRSASGVYASEVSSALLQYCDRFLVGLFLGIEAAGVYVFYWQIGNAVYNLTSSAALQPYRYVLQKVYKVNGRLALTEIGRSYRNKAVLFAMAISVGVFSFVHSFIDRLQKPIFEECLIIGAIFLLAMTVRVFAEAEGLLLFAMHQDRDIYISTFMSLIFFLMLSVLLALLLGFGLIGFSLSILISYALMAYIRSRRISCGERGFL